MASARDTIPLHVEGPGLLNCEVYQQPGRVIIHVVNLTSAGSWRAPVDELIPVGPLTIRVRPPSAVRGRTARALVAKQSLPTTSRAGWLTFHINSVSDHEVVLE